MNLSISPEVKLISGRPVTSSRAVAECFQKQHKHVVEKVKNLECSDGFRCANFSAHPYTNPQNGETYTEYHITRDGFVFLAMGFTGKKAAAFKEAYINAFNQMEEQLRNGGPQPGAAALSLATRPVQLGGSVRQCVDGRELHARLQVRTQYCDWIRRRIAGLNLELGRDFIVMNKTNASGRGGRQMNHQVTVSAATAMAQHHGGDIGNDVIRGLVEHVDTGRVERIEAANPLNDLAVGFNGRFLLDIKQGKVLSAQFIEPASAVFEVAHLPELVSSADLVPKSVLPDIIKACVARMS